MSGRVVRVWMCAAAGIAIALAGAPAASGAPSVRLREVVATRVEAAPAIDGRLDDACWSACELVGDFHLRQGAGEAPTQQTLVRVCYDASSLYVAFECFEDAMEDLSAAVAHRDADDLGEDDFVCISLDTFRDGKSQYCFCTTPIGTERDFHSTECGRSMDTGWDAVWSVGTARYDDRWIAEFSIPFSGLRYAADESEMVWGVDFRRSEKPHSEYTSWSNPSGGVLDPSEYGVLRGLRGVRRSRGIELLPFVMGKYEASGVYDYPLEPDDANWDVHPDAGLDIEYSPTTTVTASFTLNPDFAQIESDPNEINLTGNELWLEERRPFFSENANVYHHSLALLYTRRMEDILYGGKATGTLAGGTFAAMYVRSDDLPRGEYGSVLTDTLGAALPAVSHDYGALVYRQDVGKNGTVGGFFAAREGDDGHSRTTAVTVGLDPLDDLRITAMAARSDNSDAHGTDGAYTMVWSYATARTSSEGEFEWIGEDFDPKTGFVLPVWRNRKGANGSLWHLFEFEEGPFDRAETCGWAGWYRYTGGGQADYWYGGEASVRFRNAVLVGLEANRAYDHPSFPADPDRATAQLYVVLNSDEWSGAVLSLEAGRYHGSDFYQGRIGGRLQPVDPFTVEFNVRGAFLREGRDVDWWVGDLRANYRFSSSSFLRAILLGEHTREGHGSEEGRSHQYDLDLLYGWEFHPGSMLYLAYNQPVLVESGAADLEDPRVVLKISYLLTI